jgi:zinc D-Ala-D-Ala carboxypeptidase
MYTSKYFSLAETECRCKCGFDLTDECKQKLDSLREAHGKPLTMTSGARCPSYNAKVSETGTTGPHTTGNAADLAVARGDAYNVMRLAFQLGFTGIGVKQKGEGRYLHLDTLREGPGQPRPTVWSY